MAYVRKRQSFKKKQVKYEYDRASAASSEERKEAGSDGTGSTKKSGKPRALPWSKTKNLPPSHDGLTESTGHAEAEGAIGEPSAHQFGLLKTTDTANFPAHFLGVQREPAFSLTFK